MSCHVAALITCILFCKNAATTSKLTHIPISIIMNRIFSLCFFKYSIAAEKYIKYKTVFDKPVMLAFIIDELIVLAIAMHKYNIKNIVLLLNSILIPF